MKLSNLKDWKTTTLAIVGALVTVVGYIYPEKLNSDTQSVLISSLNEIIMGVGLVITSLSGLFGKDS